MVGSFEVHGEPWVWCRYKSSIFGANLYCALGYLIYNMFVKLAVLALSVVSTIAVAAPQYPAGLDPRACPNYPICSISGIQAQPQYASPQSVPVQQHNALPQYSSNVAPQFMPIRQQYSSAPVIPQYNPAAFAQQYTPQYAGASGASAQREELPPQLQAALDRGEYIGDGDYRGEGLAESGALDERPVAGAAPAYGGLPTHQQARAYAPVTRSVGPVQFPAYPQAQFPAGVDPRGCPNYPFCT